MVNKGADLFSVNVLPAASDLNFHVDSFFRFFSIRQELESLSFFQLSF